MAKAGVILGASQSVTPSGPFAPTPVRHIESPMPALLGASLRSDLAFLAEAAKVNDEVSRRNLPLYSGQAARLPLNRSIGLTGYQSVDVTKG